MLFKTFSAAVFGIDAYLVETELDVVPAFEGHFTVVGLPDIAVKESRERIRAALRRPGRYPQGRLCIRSAHGAGPGGLPGKYLWQGDESGHKKLGHPYSERSWRRELLFPLKPEILSMATDARSLGAVQAIDFLLDKSGRGA
jgi:hypothetical protein